MIPTRFAHACLGSPVWHPPSSSKRSPFHPDARCWLCGGETGGVGWPRRDVLSSAFTNHPLAPVPASHTICQACVYVTSGETWRQYVAAHPERPLKAVQPLGWHSYSHLFTPTQIVAGLRRAEIGALLADPPEPPFLLSLTESGKKHHLFRAAVATSRTAFPVQIEETRIWVRHCDYLACAAAARALFDAGASREAIESGRYHPATMQQIGLSRWRLLEAGVRPWRQREPDLLHLAIFTFTRPKEDAAA